MRLDSIMIADGNGGFLPCPALMIEPESLRLSEYLKVCMARTGSQIRESTKLDYESAMNHFIEHAGDIDILRVNLKHGEQYRQARLDKGNTVPTVNKKIRSLKRLFNLAVERGQLDENPMRFLKTIKHPKKKVIVFDSDECRKILEVVTAGRFDWRLLIRMCLETGLRKSELLNLAWWDIDFGAKTVNVTPKEDTDRTWCWKIKDSDCRELPLSDEVIDQLVELQEAQKEGHPYVFVPADRYERIQDRRKLGRWSYKDSRLSVLPNFSRDFAVLLNRAGIKGKEFHDLRRTAITNWFIAGMKINEVMVLAGHSSMTTTQEFYLAVSRELIDKTRTANDGIWKQLGVTTLAES